MKAPTIFNGYWKMVLNNVFVVLGIIFMMARPAFAQQNRYVVYFTDKINTSYSIDRPLEFLSERAVLRRQSQGINITTEDLPVNPWYLDSLTELGAEVFYTSRWFNAALIQATPAEVDAIGGVQVVSRIDYAAPGIKLSGRVKDNLQVKGTPTDMQNEFHNIDAMHNDGFTGEGKWVAVMDGGFSGVNNINAFQHLYNDNKLIMAENLINNNTQVYQYSDHGTKVLSLISGFATGEFVGAAYGASVGLFITEDVSSEFRIEEYNWLFAAEMADSAGFDIINTSLGYNTFDDPSMDYSNEDLNGATAVITIASNFASARGMLTVTSAGNSGGASNPDSRLISFPADAFANLAVGAVDSTGTKASFSSVGPTSDGRIKPDLSALGVKAKVINSAGNVVSGSGTSFSAPIVSGIAAGAWQKYPSLTMFQLRELLISWSSASEGPDVFTGYGILGYEGDINLITAIEETHNNLIIFPIPAKDRLYIKNAPSDAGFVIFDNTGRSFHISSDDGALDLSFLPSGIYLLNIRSSNGDFIHKIIKE